MKFRIAIIVLATLGGLFFVADKAAEWVVRRQIERMVAGSGAEVSLGRVAVNLPRRSVSIRGARVRLQHTDAAIAPSGIVALDAEFDLIEARGLRLRRSRPGSPGSSGIPVAPAVSIPGTLASPGSPTVGSLGTSDSPASFSADVLTAGSVGTPGSLASPVSPTVGSVGTPDTPAVGIPGALAAGSDPGSGKAGFLGGRLSVRSLEIDLRRATIMLSAASGSTLIETSAARISAARSSVSGTVSAVAPDLPPAPIASAPAAGMVATARVDSLSVAMNDPTDQTRISLHGLSLAGLDVAALLGSHTGTRPGDRLDANPARLGGSADTHSRSAEGSAGRTARGSSAHGSVPASGELDESVHSGVEAGRTARGSSAHGSAPAPGGFDESVHSGGFDGGRRTFAADSVMVERAVVVSSKNRKIAAEARSKPLLWQTLQRLPIALDIPLVRCPDLDVTYRELAADGTDWGEVSILDGRLVITNLTNLTNITNLVPESSLANFSPENRLADLAGSADNRIPSAGNTENPTSTGSPRAENPTDTRAENFAATAAESGRGKVGNPADTRAGNHPGLRSPLLAKEGKSSPTPTNSARVSDPRAGNFAATAAESGRGKADPPTSTGSPRAGNPADTRGGNHPDTRAENPAEPAIRGRFVTVELAATLMRAGEMEVRAQFPVDSLDNHWEMTGRIGQSDLTKFNSAVEPLTGVRIDRGELHELDFRTEGTRDQSHVRLAMRYDGLAVELVRRSDHHRRALASWALNDLLVRDANPSPNGRLRTGEGAFDRDETKSTFNFLWKSLLPGVKQTVL